MLSTFFGLELARRALEAQQTALDIAGHNIANANTQGYTRQIANLAATAPNRIGGLGHQVSIGSGVTLDQITRARDSYVDRQFRWETSKQQYWGSRQDSLQKVEAMFNEPSDNSLHDDMDQFWNAWSDLAKDPENMGARSVVQERAMTLADSFHHMNQQITDLQKDLDAQVRVQVHQINVYADQIKALNDQIKRAEVAGDNPNDLRDQRDNLVDQLSQLVAVRITETRDPAFADRTVNNYTLAIGNDATYQPLVEDSTVYHLNEPTADASGTFASVTWQDSGAPLDMGDNLGSLQANIKVRDEYLPNLLQQFNDLAQGLAAAVNALHEKGQGLQANPPLDFFVAADGGAVITAANISFNQVLGNNLKLIATGLATADGSVNSGDNTIAHAISSLAGGWAALSDPAIFGAAPVPAPVPAVSFGDYYGARVAQMGVDVQEANRMKAGQDVLVTHIDNQRQSYSGVSLDEEMANLVKYQKSYAAAARMVTMLDDMLNTIVNGMGITR